MYLAQYILKTEYSSLKNSARKSTEIASLNYNTSKKLKYLSGLVTTIQVYPRAESNPN